VPHPDQAEARSRPRCHTGAFPAILYAIHEGAGRVELIGLDFSDDYCLGDKPTLDRVNAMFGRMLLEYPWVEFVNLSPVSNLAPFPAKRMEGFA